MTKDELMHNSKFSDTCLSYGLNWRNFEIVDDTIFVNTPSGITTLILDKDFDVVAIVYDKYSCTKNELIEYVNNIGLLDENKLGYPFENYSLKQISRLADRIKLMECNHGHSSYVCYNNYIIDNNEESLDYINLLAYIKYLGEAIDKYNHVCLHTASIGLHLDGSLTYPTIYSYVKSLMKTIYKYCNDTKTKGNIYSYIGRRVDDTEERIALIRTLYLLENDKTIRSNDLTEKADELLKLLEMPDHKNDPNSFDVDTLDINDYIKKNKNVKVNKRR